MELSKESNFIYVFKGVKLGLPYPEKKIESQFRFCTVAELEKKK